MSDDRLNAQQVGNELGVTERTVRRWIERGELRGEKVGREVLIDLAEARKLTNGNGGKHIGRVTELEAQLATVTAERDWLRGLVERAMEP